MILFARFTLVFFPFCIFCQIFRNILFPFFDNKERRKSQQKGTKVPFLVNNQCYNFLTHKIYLYRNQSESMGATCQCSENQKQHDWNELAKMQPSKNSRNNSTGSGNLHTESVVNSYNMGQSKKMSQSMMLSRMQRVSSQNDNRVTNPLVRSRISNLHQTQASRMKSVHAQEQQFYIEGLGAKYVGQIYEGKPNGFGKLYFDNEDYLEGNFVDGRCEGNGRFIKSDGSYYEGDLKNNVADGYGLYIGKKGFKYQGQWKNNMPNGYGEANYQDGSRYVGEFLNNKRHGKGTLYQGANLYRGDFKSDKFNGKLRYEGENGEIYDGEWRNSEKNGRGTYQWPDGSSYEGSYLKDKKHGHGVMKYTSGEIYDGDWQDGLKHGRGLVKSGTHNFVGIWTKGNLTQVE